MSAQSNRIVVDGRLSVRFAEDFNGMARDQDGPNTDLYGDFVDQAHLHRSIAGGFLLLPTVGPDYLTEAAGHMA